jgi:hypothetical protein
MATEAQINANRANAKASTGPKSPEVLESPLGVRAKEKSSANATKFGLFSLDNCVHPHEEEAYNHFCDALWQDLAPSGPVQEVTAAEFVRNAWRLRRCASAEQRVGGRAGYVQRDFNKKSGLDKLPGDPMIYGDTRPAQVSIDRARVQAQGGMHRAKAYLDKLQVAAPQPQPVAAAPDAATQNTPAQNEPNSATPADAKRTQSAPFLIPRNPRNQPCPCGSGIKFKRCCASTAPPLLRKAA